MIRKLGPGEAVALAAVTTGASLLGACALRHPNDPAQPLMTPPAAQTGPLSPEATQFDAQYANGSGPGSCMTDTDLDPKPNDPSMPAAVVTWDGTIVLVQPARYGQPLRLTEEPNGSLKSADQYTRVRLSNPGCPQQ